MQIRRLMVPDSDALLELRREALTAHPLSFGSSPSDDRCFVPGFVEDALRERDDQATFGAFSDEGLQGMLGLVRGVMLKRRHTAHVWGMYVRPSFRGTGAARELVLAAIAHTRAWGGVSQLNLTVTSDAPAARRLYQTLGFVEWGTESAGLSWEGQTVDEYYMTLRLDR